MFLLWLALADAMAVQRPSSQYGGVYLTVSESVPSVMFRDKENLEITVHAIGNPGNAPEWVYRGEPGASFHVVLKGEAGKVIQPTADVRDGWARGADPLHRREVVAMKMGESWTETVDLAAVYGRLAPGAYRASVEWDYFGHVPAAGERSEHPLVAETAFVVPDDAEVSAESGPAISFTRAAVRPWSTVPTYAMESARKIAESMPFAKLPLTPVSAVRVVWYDAKKLPSEEDTARMLRVMFSSARTGLYGFHVWSFADADPALEAEVKDADGKEHRLTYWADFGGYWAYQDDGEHWYWAKW